MKQGEENRKEHTMWRQRPRKKAMWWQRQRLVWCSSNPRSTEDARPRRDLDGGKEGFSLTGFRGSTVLRIPDSELLVSKTMKEWISVYSSHPVCSTLSPKYSVSHYHRYETHTHMHSTQMKLWPSPNRGRCPCELQGNNGPLFSDPFVISASLLAGGSLTQGLSLEIRLSH